MSQYVFTPIDEIFYQRHPREFNNLQLIRPLVSENGFYVAGGAIRNIIFSGPNTPVKPRDIDVFFYTREHHNWLVNQFIQASAIKLGNRTYEFLYETPHTICYNNLKTNIPVDLVRRRFGDPQSMLDDFDFTVVKAAVCIIGGQYQLVSHTNFFEHNHIKRLEWDSVREFDPNKIFNRITKYASYGYKPTLNLKMTLFNAIKHYDGDISIKDVYD